MKKDMYFEDDELIIIRKKISVKSEKVVSNPYPNKISSQSAQPSSNLPNIEENVAIQPQASEPQKADQPTMAPDIEQILSLKQSQNQGSSQNNKNSNSRVSLYSKNSGSSSIFESEIYLRNKGNYQKLYKEKSEQISLEALTQEQIEFYKAQLATHQIKVRYYQDVGDQVIVKNVIRHNNRTFEIRLQMGIFLVQISVFNLLQHSYVYQIPKYHRSATPTRDYLLSDTTVQKFYEIDSDRTIEFDLKVNRSKFLKGLKEVALSKIMSALQIGPAFKKPLGFDIIRYRNGFSFNMQKCYQLSSTKTLHGSQCSEIQKIINQKDIYDLKNGLSTMHTFKITHNDIKQDNIMFSPAYKKCVFIDFDISACIKEQTMEATLIDGYFGTYSSLGPEMKEILQNCQKSGKKYFPAKSNLYIGDIESFSIFVANCKQAENRLVEIQKFIQSQQSQDVNKQLSIHFSTFKDSFHEELNLKNQGFDKLNLDKITYKYSGYEEQDCLWVRFYSYFYLGNMEQFKKDIIFFIDWQQWKNQKLQPKDHIMAVLSNNLKKTFQEVKNSFFYSEFSRQVIQFFKWIEELVIDSKFIDDLSITEMIRSMDHKQKEAVDQLIFSLKQQMNPDPLLQNFQSGYISLSQGSITIKSQASKPNFYQVQHELLMMDFLKKSDFSTSQDFKKTLKIIEIEDLNLLTMRQTIEKYVFYMSFRRRIGKTNQQKRKKIAQFMLQYFNDQKNFYLQCEEAKCIFKGDFDHMRSYFQDLLEGYEHFKPILESYIAIIVWICSMEDEQATKIQLISFYEFKILTMKEIMYNLVLCGYFNQKMLVEVTNLSMKWLEKIRELRDGKVDLLQTLNLLLKFRQIKEIAVYSCLIFYDVKRYKKEVKHNHPDNSSQENLESFNSFESKIIKNAQERYLKQKNPTTNKQKNIRFMFTLEYCAISHYLEFLSYEKNHEYAKYKISAQKVKIMLEENPHQIIQLYKIVMLNYLNYGGLVAAHSFFEIFNQCHLFKDYDKQDPVPDEVLRIVFRSSRLRNSFKAKYKYPYFQPQMLVIFTFLACIRKTHWRLEYKFYEKMHQIIWFEEICMQSTLIGRLKQRYSEIWKMNFNKNSLKAIHDRNSQIRKIVQFTKMMRILMRQIKVMRQRKDFFSYSSIINLIKLLEEMRVNFLFCIQNNIEYKYEQFFQILQKQFDEIIDDFAKFGVGNLDVRNLKCFQQINYILLVTQKLIDEKQETQNKQFFIFMLRIDFFCRSKQKQILKVIFNGPNNIQKHLLNIRNYLKQKILQYQEQINIKTQNQNEEIILILLVMIQLRLRLKSKNCQQLSLDRLKKDISVIKQKAEQIYLNLENNYLAKNQKMEFYFYIIDTMMLLIATIKKLYQKQIEKLNFEGDWQYQKQNLKPGQNLSSKSYEIQHNREQRIKKLMTLPEEFSSFKKQFLNDVNNPINKIIIKLYKKSKQMIFNKRIYLWSNYVYLSQQITRIFFCEIIKIQSSENYFSKFIYTPEQIELAKKRQFIKSLSQNDEKQYFYQLVFEFWVLLFQGNSIHNGKLYENKIGLLCQTTMGFFKGMEEFLQFFDIFYDKWFKVKFEARNKLTKQNYKGIQQQKRKKIQPMHAYEVFSLQNHHLPTVFSLCIMQFFKYYEEGIPKLNLKQSDIFVLGLYKRNMLVKNMIFLRNISLKMNNHWNADFQKPIYFNEVWQENVIMTHMISQDKVAHKKIENAEQIEMILKNTIDLSWNQMRTRQICISAIFSLQNYLKTLFFQPKTDSNQYQPPSYGERIYNLLFYPSQVFIKDQRILHVVEFINFFRVLTTEYSMFDKFVKLSDKMNCIELFVKLSNCGLKNEENYEFVEDLRRNKRKSNLFNTKILKRLQMIIGQETQQPFMNTYKEQNQISIFGEAILKKAHSYKVTYAQFLLKSVGISK